MIYGYLRVSTEKQTIENQREKIQNRFKVDRWVEDVGSGAKVQKNLQNLIEDQVKENDTIIITALDRLGRNVKNCAEIAEVLAMKGVTLISLREGVDFSTSSGKLAFNVMISMAEFERSAISERVKDGLERVRLSGKKLGAPKKLSLAKELEVVQSMHYLQNRYGYGFREIKLLLVAVFKAKLSIGYLCGLYKHFTDDLTGIPYPKEKLDECAQRMKYREKEILDLKSRPLFEENERF